MNLEYINDTMDRAIERETKAPTISDKARKEIRAKSRKSIAGFHVQDDKAERDALDAMIAGRLKVLEQFRTDRETVRNDLAKLDVKPLAVLPTIAWEALCGAAKLIILAPNREGMVRIYHPYIVSHLGSLHKLEKAAKDWDALMWKLFPDGRECEDRNFAFRATLVMPQPPDDVVETLLKAQTRTLKVATVPGAIGFKETLHQLYNAAKAKHDEEIAYREWLRKDPIVYTEHGSATAVLAQFGDFPIEKAVVDAVANSEHLIPEKPAPLAIESSAYTDSDMQYQRMVMEYQRQASGLGQLANMPGPQQANGGLFGMTTIGGGGFGALTTANTIGRQNGFFNT